MLIHSPKDLALLVSRQRKKLKLSQLDVAKSVGLKRNTVSAFENKPEGTKLDTLFQILSAVKLNIEISSKDKIAIEQEQWKHEW